MNKQFLSFLGCILLVFSVLICACSDTTQPDLKAIKTTIATLKNTYGVAIQKVTNNQQLPSLTVFKLNNGETKVQLRPATDTEFANYVLIIKRALSKYPSELLAKHITTIFVGGSYIENGSWVVGLYDTQKIYLFNNHPDGDNSNIFLEQTFHHEISSLLINAYGFPAFDWLALNQSDFEYLINPTKIDNYMNSVLDYKANKVQLEQGLVSTYGLSNAENDINTYVELIFTQPQLMQQYVSEYPIVKRKYKMLKTFYISLSPKFQAVFTID